MKLFGSIVFFGTVLTNAAFGETCEHFSNHRWNAIFSCDDQGYCDGEAQSKSINGINVQRFEATRQLIAEETNGKIVGVQYERNEGEHTYIYRFFGEGAHRSASILGFIGDSSSPIELLQARQAPQGEADVTYQTGTECVQKWNARSQ